ncbi:MAG: hypothetical protein WCV41_03825 [Patescibacteria group bacterium]
MLSSTLTTLQDVAFDFKYADQHSVNEDQRQKLPPAILQTLAYFDVFNFALTDWEIYKYLWVENLADKNVSYFQVREILINLPQAAYKDGFYFLAGREELVPLRKERQIIAREKYKRARRVAIFFSLLPFIKMIAVCNSLAYDNARAESDIDFFIISQKGKVWTTRFFTTLILKFLRLRPTNKTKQNKICVNFIITKDALSLQPLLVENDIYFKYWLRQLVPLYNQGDIFQKFIQENDFVARAINNSAPLLFFNQRKIELGRAAEFLKLILEKICSGVWFENFYKQIQLKMMPVNLKAQAGKGTAVVMNDCILKFHEQDRRQEYRDLWKDHVAFKNNQ